MADCTALILLRWLRCADGGSSGAERRAEPHLQLSQPRDIGLQHVVTHGAGYLGLIALRWSRCADGGSSGAGAGRWAGRHLQMSRPRPCVAVAIPRMRPGASRKSQLDG